MTTSTGSGEVHDAGTEDRRVRRTKGALREAMVALVLEQGYDAVSIDALADRAGVTRATFYAHFGTKAALLTSVVDEFANDVATAFEEPDVIGSEGGRLRVLLERARESRDVMTIIVRGEGDGAPLRRFAQVIAEVLVEDFDDTLLETEAQPRADRTLVITMWAASLAAAVAWFIERGDEPDPTDVATTVNDIAEHGWSWAAGSENRPTN